MTLDVKLLILLPVAVAIAVGCGSSTSSKESTEEVKNHPEGQPPASSSPTTAPSTAPPVTTPSSSPITQPSSSKPPTQTKPAQTGAVATQSLPAALRTEGFEYSGAGYSKPMDMQMSTGDGVVTTGTQTITFKGIKDGKAIYEIDRTGRLAALGTEEWAVTKDGVFSTKSSKVEYVGTSMELPANPRPGLTWTAHVKSDESDEKMDMTLNIKIVGKQDVKVKAGSFKDALFLEATGTGTLQGKKARTVLQNWYVKGVGTVKATEKVVTADRTATVTLEDTSTP